MLKPLLIFSVPFFMVGCSTSLSESTNSTPLKRQDWILVCNNENTCNAAGYTKPGSEHPSAVKLTRRAGGEAMFEGKMYFQSTQSGNVPHPNYRLEVNGQALGRIAPSGYLTRPQVQALIDGMQSNSPSIVVSKGKESWPISTQGARDVFRHMDEVQERTGTPSAVIDKGSMSNSLVPNAPFVPVVYPVNVVDSHTHQVDKGQADYQHFGPVMNKMMQEQCPMALAQQDDKPKALPHFRVAKLTDKRTLLMATCFSGAYNRSSLALVVKNDKPFFEPQIVSNKVNQYRQGVLTYTNKGRGLGDCMTHGKWVFDGFKFAKVSKSTTGLCREIGGGIDEMTEYHAVVAGQ
ncbi:DUF1176 domain-containing protein [Vibrio zhugei]|uniref:DUF1176 domain-containing protein n=1 Tax=Vibrio zhugei TaxID=2479546 RepID=A0ABV7CB37_9VIBR|nr:DUF1176 domain-containing protein [Vibrio zhugei]